MISIKLKTLTYSKNGPSQVSHVRMKPKEGGKKRQQNRLRQANLYFIKFLLNIIKCICLFVFKMTVKKQWFIYNLILQIFKREVQSCRDYFQEKCSILQALLFPKALPLDLSFLCSE